MVLEETAINHFVAYLSSSAIDLKKRMVDLYLGSDMNIDVYKTAEYNSYFNINVLIKNLKVKRAEWNKHFGIFNDFDVLSKLLLQSQYNAQEAFTIIFYLLEKNISTGILNLDVNVFDLKKVDSYDFHYFTRQEVKDIICSDKYNSLINTDDQKLSELDRKRKKELIDFFDNNPSNITEIKNNHLKIKEHYFDKKGNYTNEDIEIIFNTLLNDFKIDSKICLDIKSILYGKNTELLRFRDDVINFFNDLASGIKQVDSLAFSYFKSITAMGSLTGAFLTWYLNQDLALKYHLVFSNFEILSIYKKFGKYKRETVATIIFDLIKRNIESGLLEKDCKILPVSAINLNKISEFLENDLGKVATKSYFDAYNYLFKKYIVRGIPEDGNIRLVHSHPFFNTKVFVDAHQLIYDHYLAKESSFDNEDIQIVFEQLKNLELDISICMNVKSFLQTKLKARINNENVVKPGKKEEAKTEEKISMKEYNSIYHELMSYYDFQSMKMIRVLTVDEIKYCVSLLLKIGIDNNIIIKFVSQSNKVLINSDINPLLKFLYLRNKLLVYKDNEEVEMFLEDLDHTFEMMFICNDENYENYKKTIEEDMDMILQLIPNDYKYEFNK